MLEPTDRVIAKTLVSILGVISKTYDADNVAAARILTEATLQETLPNVELFLAVASLVREVAAEKRAEQAGNASPVAEPWVEAQTGRDF